VATISLSALTRLNFPDVSGATQGFPPMSWSELERFVDEVEADVALQRGLQHCRSRKVSGDSEN
jgi:hypothetical protein